MCFRSERPSIAIPLVAFPPLGADLLLDRILGYRTWKFRSFNHLSSVSVYYQVVSSLAV